MPYCHVNGIRLRYETWGVGADPLVLIHGLGSSADDWFLQLPAFAPHYRCLALDLRGHGLSDKPAGTYSVAQFARDVAGLLDQLGIIAAHVLGLSLGGMVAQQLAITCPARVRSLVLLNTLPGIWPPPRRMMRLGLRRIGATWRSTSMATQARFVAGELFPAPEQDYFRVLAEARIVANEAPAYRRATLAVASFVPGPRLGQVMCPVLIVAGDADRVVAPVYQERLRRGIPHAAFVQVPGGHACNIDHADIVNAAVLDWLREVVVHD